MQITEDRGVVRVGLTRDELAEIADAADAGQVAYFEEASGQRSVEFHFTD